MSILVSPPVDNELVHKVHALLNRELIGPCASAANLA